MVRTRLDRHWSLFLVLAYGLFDARVNLDLGLSRVVNLYVRVSQLGVVCVRMRNTGRTPKYMYCTKVGHKEMLVAAFRTFYSKFSDLLRTPKKRLSSARGEQHFMFELVCVRVFGHDMKSSVLCGLFHLLFGDRVVCARDDLVESTID